MGKINFLYETKDGEYLIGNLKNGILKDKKYYFGKLINLDFADEINLYLLDTKFNYYSKNFSSNNKKITLQDIESNLKNFDLGKNRFIGYTISNIKINGEKNDVLLGKTGNIVYTIGVYTLDNINYNNILRDFGKNIKLNIFPTSFWTVKNLGNKIDTGNLLYLGENKIEIIVIDNGFYKYIESLDIGLFQLKNSITETFGKKINNLSGFSEFHKKIYFKNIYIFLEPIILFLQDNIINDKVFVIGDFSNLPEFIQILGNKLKTNIIPVRFGKKEFKTVEKIDIYSILRNNKYQ